MPLRIGQANPKEGEETIHPYLAETTRTYSKGRNLSMPVQVRILSSVALQPDHTPRLLASKPGLGTSQLSFSRVFIMDNQSQNDVVRILLEDHYEFYIIQLDLLLPY